MLPTQSRSAGEADRPRMAERFRECGRPQMTSMNLSGTLPLDRAAGALAGRVWRPDAEGPSIVAVRSDGVFDISRAFPTIRDLCEADDPARALRAASGEPLGPLEPILAN